MGALLLDELKDIDLVKRIAITQRVVECTSYVEPRDALSQDWCGYLQSLFPASVVLPVPNSLVDVAAWAEQLDVEALVLSNGNDWGTASERDRTEIALFQYFESKGRPILGVCRGAQAVTAISGGTLVQDVGSETGIDHVATVHEVTITHGPFLELAGNDVVKVNSFHSQGILQSGLSQGFQAFAVAVSGEASGLVEGLYHETLPILGIQWHPERPSPSAAFDKRLINALFEDGAFWK